MQSEENSTRRSYLVNPKFHPHLEVYEGTDQIPLVILTLFFITASGLTMIALAARILTHHIVEYHDKLEPTW